MIKLTYLYLFIIAFFACNSNRSQAKKNEPFEKKALLEDYPQNIEKDFKFVYSLNQNDTIKIGDVYVKWKNDSIFTDLYVVNKKDTIYSIKKNIFSNTRGIDLESGNLAPNGYIFTDKKNDFFEIYSTNDQGIGVSDPAVIKWNNEEKIMEFERTP